MTIAETTRTRHAPVFRMASGARVTSYSLADPEMAARVAAFKAEITASPEAAGKFLTKVGILNRSGKLSRNFGG